MLMTIGKRKEYRDLVGSENLNRIEILNRSNISQEENREAGRMLYGNLLATEKYNVRKAMKLIDEVYDNKRNLKKHLQQEMDRKPFINKPKVKRLEDLIAKCDYGIVMYNDYLAAAGERIIRFLEEYEKYASVHDLAQICNANMIQVGESQKRLQEMDNDKGQANLFVDLVFVADIEYRGKGDFITRADDVPLREAIFEYMMKLMETNKEFKSKTDEALFEYLPELRGAMYTVQTDAAGNVIGAEKYYPSLKPVK